jgi:hypothetical protein
VKGRALWALSAGLLLSAPLVLIAVYTVREHLSARTDEGSISPILSFEERLRLVTYQRPCGKGRQCEPPLGCLPYARDFTSYCTDSECLTDEQCREGFRCQTLRTSQGPQVRACIPLGARQEGQRCESIPASQSEACGAGLLCGAGWCGRPCQKGAPESCPRGFFCADVTPGPLCLPSCETAGCPEDQRCVSLNRGASACRAVHGDNCQQAGCPAGQACEVFEREDHPDEVWMACTTACGRQDAPSTCPEGLVCEYFSCKKPCDPKGPEVCGPGFYCGRFRPDRPWVCRFDRRGARMEDEER